MERLRLEVLFTEFCIHNAVFAVVFPTYERDVQALNEYIGTFLHNTFNRGHSDAENFYFYGALNARQFLKEHLHMSILPDRANKLLCELDVALQGVIERLATELDKMLQGDSMSIRVTDDLDRLFDGMRSVAEIQPQTKITRTIVAEYRSFQNKLFTVLRGYCVDAKTANYDNTDNGVPFLQQMQRDTINEMFHPSWIKGGVASDGKEKMRALRTLLPDQYRRCVTHFVD